MRESAGIFWKRSLVFNRRFADEHDGNVIAYGIYTVTLAALQPLPLMNDFNGCLAERADEDLQQIRIYGHAGNGSTGMREKLGTVSNFASDEKLHGGQ